MTSLAVKARSRGYWHVTVRPSRFDENHVADYGRLFSIVRDCSVELRGWDFPHIDTRKPPVRETNWVGQETDWNHYVELWRLYRSGQFLFIGGYEEDWRDQSGLWPAHPNWVPGKFLRLYDTLWSLTEFLEFAARLSATEAGAARVSVSVTFGNLKGRVLYNDNPNMDPNMFSEKATAESWVWERTVTRGELAGGVRELSRAAASDLFARFGFEVDEDALRRGHEELFAIKRGR